jgi:hypothetical protein
MPSPLLNLAAESGYAEVVKVLLDEANVPVDSLGEFGTSPLFDACYFDNRWKSTDLNTFTANSRLTQSDVS